VLALAYGFPLLWFVLSSFKPAGDLFSFPLSLLPKSWTVQGYIDAWSSFNFYQFFANTFLVAIVTTILTVVASCTGYALAKYDNRWLKVFFVCILATTMLPTGVVTGRDAIGDVMRKGYWRTGRPLQQLHYEHVDVRMLGRDDALVTGEFVLTGAGHPDRTGWFTTVWMRTPKGWRMIHDHS